MGFYVVRVGRGGPWDWSRDMREQAGWDDHASFMAGLGGAYLSLVQTPLWVERMTAGRGWIALALVVFAAWRPWRVLLGAYLFGGITILQLHSQALGVKER